MRTIDTARNGAIALLLLGLGSLAACSDVVGGERGGGDGDEDGEEEEVLPSSIDEIDLLLVIDGSGSMADKQGFLAASMRPFLERLRSPKCVDGSGVIGAQPPDGEACPEGSVREYTPDVTVHVGVVSSSLWASSICNSDSGPNRFDDDQAHLLTRAPDRSVVPSYQGLGFFAWDPGQKLSPPGDADFDTFAAAVETTIRGVGELGCGFEAPLEAMARFLAEPEPQIQPDGGLDQVLLDQRASFLRPTSVLSVILLSDENDCSMSPTYAPIVQDRDIHMPRARAECAADPTDACCAACIAPIPDGCSGDGGCAAPGDAGEPGNYHGSDDPENTIQLRCWDSKRRFGFDALEDVDRYVDVLSSSTLARADGTPVGNPVFAGGRSPADVLYTAVVGVPWQDLARDPSVIADGFQSPREMVELGTWGLILGDPESNVPPTDTLMIESSTERSGPIPATGESLPAANLVNGGERETNRQDLQYACVFDLPTEARRECMSVDTAVHCDCRDEVMSSENPLCAASGSGGFTLQVRAKAYPGLRQLDVARRLADQGRVVPMCGLLLEEGQPDPGGLGTMSLELGLGDAAEQIASMMSQEP